MVFAHFLNTSYDFTLLTRSNKVWFLLFCSFFQYLLFYELFGVSICSRFRYFSIQFKIIGLLSPLMAKCTFPDPLPEIYLSFLPSHHQKQKSQHSPACAPGCCSVAQSCPTLCYPMDCNTSGFPVFHHLLEFAETHVHRVGDAIQPSRLLSSPSPPFFNLYQH